MIRVMLILGRLGWVICFRVGNLLICSSLICSLLFCSDHSDQMSDCERFAQISQDKLAICSDCSGHNSDLLRLPRTN